MACLLVQPGVGFSLVVVGVVRGEEEGAMEGSSAGGCGRSLTYVPHTAHVSYVPAVTCKHKVRNKYIFFLISLFNLDIQFNQKTAIFRCNPAYSILQQAI